MSGIIEVDNLVFRYTSDRTILNEIDFEVKAGTFLAIAGPNGAGKSTLLNLMCGMIVPESGVIRIDASPVSSYSCEALAAKVAVVRQEFVPAFGFSVILHGRQIPSMLVRASASLVIKARSSLALGLRWPVSQSMILIHVMPAQNMEPTVFNSMQSVPGRFQIFVLLPAESRDFLAKSVGNLTIPSAETSQPASESRSMALGSGSNFIPISSMT